MRVLNDVLCTVFIPISYYFLMIVIVEISATFVSRFNFFYGFSDEATQVTNTT